MMEADHHHKSVEQLREENAARWEKLQALLLQLHQDPSVTTTTTTTTTPRSLDEDKESQSHWEIESDKLLQRLDINTTEESLEHACATEDIEQKDEYAAELVKSFHDLKQLNSVLRQDIARTRNRLNKILLFREEIKEINAELEAELRMPNEEQLALAQQKQQQQLQPEEFASSLHQHGIESIQEDVVQQVNEKLRMDLRYVTECIDGHQRSSQPSETENDDDDSDAAVSVTRTTTSGGNRQDHRIARDELWSLEQLLLHLIELQLSASSPVLQGEHTSLPHAEKQNCHDHRQEDNNYSYCPYISVETMPVQKEHVELLKRYEMLETHEDDDTLIRLLDYRQ